MDLAVGAKRTWVMMDLLDKNGASKIVARCTYPLTGIGCVQRVYTDYATFACTPRGLRLLDCIDGCDRRGIERIAGLPLTTEEE
jgi:3-oxoadipate CoA-transferase beta subunit